MGNVLVLSPHLGDAEIYCGGTMAKLIEGGSEIFLASFSYAQELLSLGFSRNAIKKESLEAADILGIPIDNLYRFDLEVREFPSVRQIILNNMELLRKDIRPGMVLLPSSSIIHQGYETIYKEGMRVFSEITLLGYENIWRDMGHSHMSTYVRLKESHIMKKMEAMKCYESQMKRNDNLPQKMAILAKLRGSQIKCQYAEIFENIRMVIV